MKINDNDEGKIFVKDLRKDPLYKYTNTLDLGPINYLVANKKYSYEEISEFINNAQNINYNYKKFNKEEKNEEENQKENNFDFKILGYFSLDSKNSELIFIGNKYKFKIDLSIIPIDKENLQVLNMPFYAVVTLVEHSVVSNGATIYSYKVSNLEFIEAINFSINDYKKLRSEYSTKEWFDLVIATLGYNPSKFTIFEKFNFLTRLIPYCTEKYNYIELGNFETGKSFFFKDLSKRFSTLISANKLSIPKLIYDNSINENGLIVTKNVIAMDEFVNTNFTDKDIIPVLKTYLEDGEVSRDGHTIKGIASIVLLGNISNIENNLSNSVCLFDQFKMKIENPTFFDKFYHFSPGWKISSIDPYSNLCNDSEERLSLDFFINSLTKLRYDDSYYESIVDKFIQFEGTSSGRTKRIVRTVAGLLKILHPDGNVTPEEIEIYAYVALCGRKLLLDQLNIMNPARYTNSLYATSKTTDSVISSHNYYNLSILLSESLFSNSNLSLSDIEYYYCDYNYFDRFSTNSVVFPQTDITANAINKKLDFELIEPRLAIKFKGDEHIYKLALSTYGINANVIEYDENNDNVEYLNDNFILIKSKDFIKPNYVHKLKHYSNVFWDKLKEENKDNTTIKNLINIIEKTNKNMLALIDENIELKNKVENLDIQLNENEIKLDKLFNNFYLHKHSSNFNSNLNGAVYLLPTDSNSEEDSISLFFKHYNRNNTEKNNCNNLNMFDYEKINKLREEYIKAKKNNQN